jgi:hypothetical protein
VRKRTKWHTKSSSKVTYLIDLKEGLVLDPTIEAFGRGAVTCVRGEEILKKWRS